MELQQDIHIVDGVVCNVYLIFESDGVTMIDTGLPGKDKAITAYLRKMGRSVRDLHRIVLTHQHVDHIGNVAELSAGSGAEIFAHPLDAMAIEGKEPRELPNAPLASFLMRAMYIWRLRPVPAKSPSVRPLASAPANRASGHDRPSPPGACRDCTR